LPWIALPVQASDDDHDVIVEPIEDPVWESDQKGPPGIAMDHRIQGGLCGNALEARLEGLPKTHRRGQDAGLRTTETLRRNRRPLPDERRWASQPAVTDVAKDFFPWNAGRPVAIQLVKPPVQLFSLGACQGDPLRRRAETLPEFLHQPQPLLSAQTGDIYGSHATSISTPQKSIDPSTSDGFLSNARQIARKLSMLGRFVPRSIALISRDAQDVAGFDVRPDARLPLVAAPTWSKYFVRCG
jgi:hypothetical protein